MWLDYCTIGEQVKRRLLLFPDTAYTLVIYHFKDLKLSLRIYGYTSAVPRFYDAALCSGSMKHCPAWSILISLYQCQSIVPIIYHRPYILYVSAGIYAQYPNSFRQVHGIRYLEIQKSIIKQRKQAKPQIPDQKRPVSIQYMKNSYFQSDTCNTL